MTPVMVPGHVLTEALHAYCAPDPVSYLLLGEVIGMDASHLARTARRELVPLDQADRILTRLGEAWRLAFLPVGEAA